MRKIVQAFKSGKTNHTPDEYTKINDMEYIKKGKILRITHEVDMNKLSGKEYLDTSSAEHLTNSNKSKVCASDFGILLKNNLVNIQHIYLNKTSKHLLLNYSITQKDCHAEK
jgi:hypothetical protein